jgi:serine protease Do
LIEYGRVRRAWLGVAMRAIDAISAESYGLPTVSGVELTLITEGGPSEAQGLSIYDVIVEIDGQAIGRVGQMQQAIAMKRPGDRIAVRLYRDGRPMTVNVRLGEAPLQGQREIVTVAEAPRDDGRMDNQLGLRIENMDRTSALEFGYDEVDGVVITDVVVNGPAERRGVAPGWKILEINREPVRRRSDVDRIMAKVEPGGIVTLHVAAPNDNRQIFHIRVSR